MSIKEINKEIKKRTKKIEELNKTHNNLIKKQRDAITLLNTPKLRKNERDQYNKFYFHYVTMIDNIKNKIFIEKTKIKTLESERDLLLLTN